MKRDLFGLFLLCHLGTIPSRSDGTVKFRWWSAPYGILHGELIERNDGHRSGSTFEILVSSDTSRKFDDVNGSMCRAKVMKVY